MTLRSKIHFDIIPNSEWTDNKNDRYSYGKLNQTGYSAKQEGTVDKQYVLKLGNNLSKVDAPNPPFTQGEQGDLNKK